jgi:hypothetical protein
MMHKRRCATIFTIQSKVGESQHSNYISLFSSTGPVTHTSFLKTGSLVAVWLVSMLLERLRNNVLDSFISVLEIAPNLLFSFFPCSFLFCFWKTVITVET